MLSHLFSEVAFLFNSILMAFLTSVFLAVQITGFNMGVIRVQNTAIALSMGKVATGQIHKYTGHKEEDNNCDVGATGRQGSFPPCRAVSPHGAKDEHIGYQQHYKSNHRDYPTIDSNQETSKESVSAGKLYQGEYITREVIHYVGTTEREPESDQDLSN